MWIVFRQRINEPGRAALQGVPKLLDYSRADSAGTFRAMTLWIAILALAAQASSFEVASVKPVNPPAGPHVVSLNINHGILKIEAAELRQIVGLAYAVQRIRVRGGPG